MRASLALFIVLAVAFVCVDTSAAAPGGDVKSSPLFKRSLEESIATLEGKALQANDAKGKAEAMPTGKPGCDQQPDAPLTSYGNTCSETCSPTQCGGECYTQANTCYPTACGGTCAATTCGTCQGEPTCVNTCTNTCVGVGGSCTNYHFYGTVSWLHNNNQGSNWFGIGDGIVPYWSEDGHGVHVRFADESSYTRIAYINYNNGYYNGYRLRTTTSAGMNIKCSGPMTADWYYPYWWPTDKTVYLPGPRPVDNAVNIVDLDVSPWF